MSHARPRGGLRFRCVSFLGIVFIAVAHATIAASAGEVRKVVSPGGITAWLAEDHASPLLSLRLAFIGGSAAEPAGQAGISRVLARLLLEGSRDTDFKVRAQRAGLRAGFQSGRDALFGNIDFLTEHSSEAIDLIRANLGRPRLDAKSLEGVRAKITASLAEAASDPRTVANDNWYTLAFEHQTYGHSPDGQRDSIAALTNEDMAAFYATVLTRARLVVVAAGDISSPDLADLLDAIFGILPTGSNEPPGHATFKPAAKLAQFNQSFPGASIAFGLPAPIPGHANYAAARVVTHILGSGDFNSRLIQELRLRLGLVYSAQATLVHDRFASLIVGDVSTSNENAENASAALQATIAKLASEGPTQDEMNSAKAAIVGASLLSLDSNARIADALLLARLDGQPIDFVTRQSEAIASVNLAQARRVAKEILIPETMPTVIVRGKAK